MIVRLGINPITWTNDDMPELGGDIPLETCLAETQLAGYAGIELGGKFPRDPALLHPLLERHALRLVSGWYSAHLARRSVAEEAKNVDAHLRLLEAMGFAPEKAKWLSSHIVVDPSRGSGHAMQAARRGDYKEA